MINLDDVLTKKYLEECHEHLTAADANLLVIGKSGAEIDEELVNQVYWTVHSVRAAGFFDLVKISDLAYQTEGVLALIRSRKMVPTGHRVRVLLRATGTLDELIQNPGASNRADISEVMSALSRLRADHLACAGKAAPTIRNAQQGGGRLRALVVEDGPAGRLLLKTFLSRYGECRVVLNGREGVEAFRSALEQGQKYDLICLDIMMPEMDGREALRQMRALEKAHGMLSSGARIIMTTAVSEVKEVIQCFQEFCDSYLTKPIDLAELLSQMKSYELIQ
jgi:two-component system chemotaxis response regulator CheY